MYKDIIRFLDDNSSTIHCPSGWDFNTNTDSEKLFFMASTPVATT